jgi:asparagine synthase (glutamine-hydrolysing)
LDIRRYYDIRNHCLTDDNLDYKEAVKKFKSLFNDSIKLRLRSDVQVGSCFSGGLDSSSIVSLMNEHIDNENISTFSAVYPGFEKDESYYIDKQVKKMGIKNKKISPTVNDLLGDIEDFIYCQESPTRSTSQYSQYCVMKLARRNNFKVLLDGQGSDEILAGYHYFYGYYFLELIKKLKFVTLFKELRFYNKNVNSSIGIKGVFFLLLPSYLKMRYFDLSSSFIDHQFKKIWKDKSEYIDNVINKKDLKNVLLSHADYKLEELLTWEDRNSMAFSIETRVPFLDYRLVEFVFTMPSSFIIKNGLTKAILRDAMDEKVEKEVINRSDKIGFETPEDKWIREEPVSSFIRGIITSSSFSSRKYFNSKKILNLFESHLAGRINIGMKIWQCVFLELWLRRFIDNISSSS